MAVTRFDKILAAIEKRDGIATKTDIKQSIAEFHNKAGGGDELEKILADMVAQGILLEHLHEAGNGKTIKFYRSRNSNAIRANPIQGDINMYATINLTNKGRDFARELVELLATRLNAGELLKSFVVPANIDKESSTPDSSEVPFDSPKIEKPSRLDDESYVPF